MKPASIVPGIVLLSVALLVNAASDSKAATASLPVNVINTELPTVVKNTVQVAGTVGLAGGASVGIASMPAVNIASMPSVQIAGTPTVNIANLPATGQAVTTQLVFHQQLTFDANLVFQTEILDVSSFRDVRVTATGNVEDYAVSIYTVDESGIVDFQLDRDIIQGGVQGTRLYEIPGRKLKIRVFAPSSGGSGVIVTLNVFGRS